MSEGPSFVPAVLFTIALISGSALADGTEGLGPATIKIAEGSDAIVGGVGMKDRFTGTIKIDIPAAVRVKQVLAYWEGQAFSATEQGATDGIFLNDIPVTGTRIGGPTNFFYSRWTSTYRADVTALGLVASGPNSVVVRGMDFKGINNGAGLIVIIDDGVNTGKILIRDGNDNAFAGFARPLDTTTPVVYDFAPSTVARTATLNHFLGSVSSKRPSVIEVKIDGVVTETLVDVLGNLDGMEWDTYSHEVMIPAGAKQLSVRILSKDAGGSFAGELEASLTWCFCSLTLPPVKQNKGCMPAFWKKMWWTWDGRGRDDVTRTIKTSTRWNAWFGVTPAQSGLPNRATVFTALVYGHGARGALNRQAAASLLNADSITNYLFTLAQIRSVYRDAVGADAGPETIRSGHAKFALANRLVCKRSHHHRRCSKKKRYCKSKRRHHSRKHHYRRRCRR